MRIGKPLLLTSTTVGLALGIYEGWHLTGRLMWLFLAPILLFGAGIAWIVCVARRESRGAGASHSGAHQSKRD